MPAKSSLSRELDPIDEITDTTANLNVSNDEDQGHADLFAKAQSTLEAARAALPKRLQPGDAGKGAGNKLGGRDFSAPAGTRLGGRDQAAFDFTLVRPAGTKLGERDYLSNLKNTLGGGTKLSNRDKEELVVDDEIDVFTDFYGIPRHFAPSAAALAPDIVIPVSGKIKTVDDALMLDNQLNFDNLGESEQRKQTEWVGKLMDDTDPCPEGHKVSS